MFNAILNYKSNEKELTNRKKIRKMQERMVDALALGGDEGRDKLR